MRQHLCLCAEVPRVETRTRFLVVRHEREAWRSSNSARVAALALPRLSIVPYGGRDTPLDEARFRAAGTWLLFPGSPPPPPGTPPPETLVVVDGSYRQARRIVHHVESIRGLPRLSLPGPPPEAPRARQPPTKDGMGTLEAIAAAVRLLEGPEVSAPLERLLAKQVQGVLRGRRETPPVV